MVGNTVIFSICHRLALPMQTIRKVKVAFRINDKWKPPKVLYMKHWKHLAQLGQEVNLDSLSTVVKCNILRVRLWLHLLVALNDRNSEWKHWTYVTISSDLNYSWLLFSYFKLSFSSTERPISEMQISLWKFHKSSKILLISSQLHSALSCSRVRVSRQVHKKSFNELVPKWHGASSHALWSQVQTQNYV